MTRFITEENLKGLYKEEVFTEYRLKKEERLTPGGRQYLLDKGIKIIDEIVKEKECFNEIKEEKIDIVKKDYGYLKIKYKFKVIEILFFKEINTLVQTDILVAQNVMDLGKKISNIIKFLDMEEELEQIKIEPCIGITKENFKENLEECFKITDVFIYLEKRSIILNLNYILCNLKELQCEIEEQEGFNEIKENLNMITNRLLQIICKVLGGVVCQKEKKGLNIVTS